MSPLLGALDWALRATDWQRFVRRSQFCGEPRAFVRVLCSAAHGAPATLSGHWTGRRPAQQGDGVAKWGATPMGRETGHDAMEKLQMYGSVFRPVSVRVGGLFLHASSSHRFHASFCSRQPSANQKSSHLIGSRVGSIAETSAWVGVGFLRFGMRG